MQKISNGMSRREFIKLGSLLAAAAGMAPYANIFAKGLSKLAGKQINVLWLQAQSCSGCSVSLLNSVEPGPFELLTDYIHLVFHQTIGAAQGHQILEVIEKMQEKGNYIVAVEGSLPGKMPEACVISGKNMDELLPPILRKARYVVGIGTCATFGGIPAAEGNPTGALSLKEFMEKHSIPTKGVLVNCSTCPVHPDSVVGTLAWLAGKGYPAVDPVLLTPNMYYARSTHDNCPRYHYYAREIFAKKFGDEGCLFKLGCVGFLARTECPQRQWNNSTNWCVRANAPCLACSSPDFAKRKDFPFYRKNEKNIKTFVNETARKGE